jgi:hypothetical protein
LVAVSRHAVTHVAVSIVAPRFGLRPTHAAHSAIVAERQDLRVECQPAQPGSEVVVTDDLTALSARGQQVIERFAEDFGSFLDGWRRSIEAALGA